MIKYNRRQYYLKHRKKWAAYRKRRRKELKEFLKQFLVVCKRCGATEKLLFHHRDPVTKRYKVSKMWGMREEVILAEIQKCDVVCRGCHTRIHLHNG